jgi:medium-chain acyl-[acyl-carrier-protein] hydrolase
MINKDWQKWFTFQKNSPTTNLRVFLFPFAGGDVNAYQNWGRNLPLGVELVYTKLPGRGMRFNESAFNSIEPLVHELCDAIKPFINTPFVFFGHSMGALIAFELCLGLRRQNLSQPHCLFLSALKAPQLMNQEAKQTHRLPDRELIQEISKLGGIPEELLANEELLEILLPTLRADMCLCETYKYQAEERLAIPLVIFGGNCDPLAGREELEAWRLQSNKGVTVRTYQGGHFYFMEVLQPFLPDLTHYLQMIQSTLANKVG